MEEIDRRIGARSAARLLGDWRPPDGRGLTDALADRVRLLILDGRLPLQTRMPAERDRWFTPAQAVEYGLVDRVLTRSP